MDLINAQNIATDLIQKYCPDYRFRWNNRKKSFGLCRKRPEKIIFLSEPYTKINDEHKVRLVILHEIAHAMTQCMGHNKLWRETLLSIGGDGERCFNPLEVNIPKAKYMYVCQNCGRKVYYGKILKRILACGICCKAHNNNKFSNEFRLVIKDGI